MSNFCTAIFQVCTAQALVPVIMRMQYPVNLFHTNVFERPGQPVRTRIYEDARIPRSQHIDITCILQSVDIRLYYVQNRYCLQLRSRQSGAAGRRVHMFFSSLAVNNNPVFGSGNIGKVYRPECQLVLFLFQFKAEIFISVMTSPPMKTPSPGILSDSGCQISA